MIFTMGVVDILLVFSSASLIMCSFIFKFSWKRKAVNRRRLKTLYLFAAFSVGFFFSLVVNLSFEGGYVDIYGDRGALLETAVDKPFTITNQSNVIKQKIPNHLNSRIEEYELPIFKAEIAKSGKRIIWFLTATDFTITQDVKLTNIGQTLFPIRDFVVWVIIKVEDSKEIINERSSSTSKHILKTVQRFGIPFVLLKSKRVLAAELGTDGKSYYRYAEASADYKVYALQTGLVWIFQNVNNGILMLAEDNFVFNYPLFHEVLETKTVSVWPVGTFQQNDFIFSPVVSNNSSEVTGYFSYTYRGLKLGSMKIVRGGFAINIEYMKTLDKKKVWMLTYDDSYNFQDIDIPMSKIQPIADRCTKIYMWRIHIMRWPWPKEKSIKISKKYNDTNIMALLKNCYNYKFYDIVKIK